MPKRLHFSHPATGLTAIVPERTFMELDAVVWGVESALTGGSVVENPQIFDWSERPLHIRPLWPVWREWLVQDRQIVAAGRR